MDRKRIHIDLVFAPNDLNRARNIRDQIRSELNAMGVDIHRLDADLSVSREDDVMDTGNYIAHLQVRFVRNHTHFRDFLNTLRQSIPANKLLVGSRIAIHDCNHDDIDVHPCVETVLWEKT